MTGIILDSILMLLLVAAIGYGIKLEKKLKALREGQLAFAGAVSELNAAIDGIRASGEYQKISQHYFKSDIYGD